MENLEICGLMCTRRLRQVSNLLLSSFQIYFLASTWFNFNVKVGLEVDIAMRLNFKFKWFSGITKQTNLCDQWVVSVATQLWQKPLPFPVAVAAWTFDPDTVIHFQQLSTVNLPFADILRRTENVA